MPLYKPSEQTVEVRLQSGGYIAVPAFEDADGELIVPTQHRQELTGGKCHGGHCAICGAELQAHTRESFRGVCDDCAKDDPRWSE